VTQRVGVIVPPDQGHHSQALAVAVSVQAEHIVRAVDDRPQPVDRRGTNPHREAEQAPCVAGCLSPPLQPRVLMFLPSVR
jgi:hypothetical protein